MKINDIILTEDTTCSVARFYKEGGKDFDRFYNPEDFKYKMKNQEYYQKYFDEWFDDEEVPVFTKPVDKPQQEYRTKPQGSALQTPGYRGLQYALAAAGLPYNHNVQEYKTDPSRAVASQTMDGLNIQT